MKKVLITGTAGFVGANLAHRLVEEGHGVHVVVSPQSRPWRIAELQGRAVFHRLDLAHADLIRQTVEAVRPDWVFHLAAHGAYSWQTDTTAIFHTNLMGTIHLVEACRKVGIEAMVHTGSSSEYGYKDHAPAEDTFIEPNSSYAVAKAAATLYCRHVAQTSDLRICTLRLYSVYGRYEEPARLMPTLLMHAQRGGYPPLARPTIARDYIYIDDVLDACLAAVSAENLPKGAVYNLGTGKQTTLAEVVDAVRKIFGLRLSPTWASMPDRRWDTDTWVSDNRLIRRELNWQPKTQLVDGLRCFRHWLAQPQWQSFYGDRLQLRRVA